MKNIISIILLTILSTTYAIAGTVYYVTPSEVNQVRKVEIGQIIGLKHVRINEDNFVRTAVGGGIGYAVGSQIGGGSGNTAAKIVGTLLGASMSSKKTKATELTVRTERGNIISIIQRGTWNFSKNETVKVMHGKQGRNNVSYVDSLY